MKIWILILLILTIAVLVACEHRQHWWPHLTTEVKTMIISPLKETVEHFFSSSTYSRSSPSSSCDILNVTIPGHVKDRVMSVIADNLRRSPTESETRDYGRLLACGVIDVKAMTDIIRQTLEYRNLVEGRRVTSVLPPPSCSAMLTSELEKEAAYIDEDTYRDIVSAFSTALQRVPSDTELDHFYREFLDGSMDKAKLLRLLDQHACTAETEKKKQEASAMSSTCIWGRSAVGGPGAITEYTRDDDTSIRIAVANVYKDVYSAHPPPLIEKDLVKRYKDDMNRSSAALRQWLLKKSRCKMQTVAKLPPTTRVVRGENGGTDPSTTTITYAMLMHERNMALMEQQCIRNVGRQ